MKIWLVMKHWEGGKREIASAYSNEEDARFAAAELVGRDCAMITLATATLDPQKTIDFDKEVGRLTANFKSPYSGG